MTDQHDHDAPPITELSHRQRRVLGVLVEKAFTTPDAYPLTLKALTTGCNQKSNRHPTTAYDEDDVIDVLEQLRKLGLAIEVHTGSGRTERYRHYMRKRFTFTEPQLAVVTELMLRGRQTLGELRGRAGRMVAIESLEQLRDELRGLQELDILQADGPLERRGVEVDHNLYTESEGRKLPASATAAAPAESRVRHDAASSGIAAPAVSTTIPDVSTERLTELEAEIIHLRAENQELRSTLDDLQNEIRRIVDEVGELRRDLGG